MAERAEALHPAPKIIDVLGAVPPIRSSFAQILAMSLSADLVVDKVSTNPFRRKYLEDPKKWSFKYHSRSVAEKMGALQKLIKGGEGRRIIIFPSFEMNRLSIEVERNLGLISERDYELFADLFRTFKDMGAMRRPDVTLCIRNKPTNVVERELAKSFRAHIEKRDERFIMFFDMSSPDSYKERLHHMSKWVDYLIDGSK